MPRNGKLVRVALLATVAAVVAVVAVTTAGAASAKSSGTSINGAGSTFVAPLVNKWINPVASALGITLNYNAIGSTGGVIAITTKQADFGASDAPLTQFNPTCTTCVQIAWALAATSVIYNMHGLQFLRMSGPVLAKIYMGKITKWNDPAIKALNPGKNLPSENITVVHRSDGSGTSYNFTDFLSHVSAAWNSQYGTGTSVSWWPGSLGVPKSSGVANAVKTTPGAIGYVDVDYAVVNHLGFFRIKNKSGNYVLPKLPGIRAAAQLQTHPNKDGSLSIVNPPKSKKYAYAYPISTYTYIDVQKSSGAKAAALKQLIGWAISKGQAYGGALFFARLPGAVVHFDKGQIAKIHS
jgi:phosphate transport system substrate-binding protein